MSSLRLLAAVVLSSIATGNLYAACDTYEYKRDLAKGYNITLSNSCSTQNIIELGSIGKEKVTVDLYARSIADVKAIAATGVLLTTGPKSFKIRQLQQIANIGGVRLTANVHRLGEFDAKNIALAGSNLIIDNSYSGYDAMEVCQKVIPPAIGYVYTKGFSLYDLDDVVSAGCTLVDVDQKNLNPYDAERYLKAGARIEIDGNFSGMEARKLAELAKDRLTVDLSGFPTFEAKKIAEAGANVRLDNSFSGFEASEICKLVKAPATGKVTKMGYSDFDLKRIIESGCSVHY
jgi:hypothetical protein